MTAAADALMRLAALTWTQDEALSAWAATAARKLQSGLSADRALGMDPATMARLRRQARNHYLREAFQLVDGPGPWSRALALAAEINRFETAVLPHWQASGGPPTGASKLRTALWQARLLGKLPGPRMLAEICRGF